MARKEKGGERWFVGSITDENAREATVTFSFLPKGRKYTATIYADAEDASYDKNPMAYDIYEETVSQSTTLTIPCAPSGGFAIAIVPKK